MIQDIRNFDIDELKEIVSSLNEPVFRANQIFKWLYEKGIEDFSQMSDIPENLRTLLTTHYSSKLPEPLEIVKSKDHTKKFLFHLKDGNLVETVLIPEKVRNTVCVSSQVGCKFGCVFCASGKMGFIRNLETSEIIGQILHIKVKENIKISNVVFMGMGEPFDNYHNIIKAIRILNCKQGLNIAARKITISTAGIVPFIDRFSNINWQVRLSVSLHAPDDKIRNRLMPINHKYPLAQLQEACKRYIEKTGRRITLEYLLIKDINCTETSLIKLAQIAKTLNANVNIILFNRIKDVYFSSPSQQTIYWFVNSLKKMGIATAIRNSRGKDINAACGQLASKKNSTCPI